MRKNYQLMRLILLSILAVLVGVSTLTAQSSQEKLMEMNLVQQAIVDKITLRSDVAMWDSMVMFVYGTNKRFGKFVNLEFDKNGSVLKTDVYAYDDEVGEVRTREEMTFGYNFPYYHARYENLRLLELKQTVPIIAGMNMVTTITQKWDTNGLMTL